MTKNIILVSALCMLCSCSFMAQKVILGVRAPRIETTESVTEYLVKLGLDTSNAYFVNDSLYLPLIQSSSAYFSKYEVYNSNFERIIPTDSLVNQCYGTIYNQLMFISDERLWKRDSVQEININLIRSNILTLSGSPGYMERYDGIDRYVVFYWAKFMGKYSSNLLDIAKSLRDEEKSNVMIILVNMDKHHFMNDTVKQINFDFSNGG